MGNKTRRPILEGKKALIVGIANEHSIAYGCARAFREAGADIAITYLNDKARPHVEPLAKAVESPLFLPLDVSKPGDTEALFGEVHVAMGAHLELRRIPRVAGVGGAHHVTELDVACGLACVDVERRNQG